MMDASQLIAFRRALHEHPEVGLHLPWTQGRILDALSPFDLEITTGSKLSSVVAVLRGGAVRKSIRPLVLVRSDMDALPVVEATGLPWASTNGAMHACGHDLHMTMLLQAIEQLDAIRSELPGDVLFEFQPGEENWGGAPIMHGEGLFEIAGRRPDAALGLHVLSYGLPHGALGLRHGAILAACHQLTVAFHGRGTHGSAPELGIDPVPAIAEFITAVQTGFTRSFSMFDDVILTIGKIRAGERPNVISADAELEGTLRTFSDATSQKAAEVIHRTARGIAEANGVTVDTQLHFDCPATVSDTAEADFAFASATRSLGEQAPRWLERPFSVGEDFAWTLQEVPGSFALLGACHSEADWHTASSNHAADAIFDDDVMQLGADFETGWVADRLAALAEDAKTA